MIRDIKPRSPTTRLRRDYSSEELARPVSTVEAMAALGMSRSFVARALGYSKGSRPPTITLAQLIELLEVDGYQETFLPRSMVPDYLLGLSNRPPEVTAGPRIVEIPDDESNPKLAVGNARDLLRCLPPNSVQCAMTSSPYWGMRVYDNHRDVSWADGERCPYGFEQTPEGFIRHTVELLHLLKPAMARTGSVWWNLMDTYNTRTPIRGSSRDKLRAMGGDPDHALGWTEHEACRHSAGHMYLEDSEMASIPWRVAERASRIGYWLKSFITWNKDSTPEPVKTRVTRQAEYVVHLAAGPTPFFDKAGWRAQSARVGGPNELESSEKLTDVWTLPTATGANGHGAEFPTALPGRCIALTSQPGDLVLDPFTGSGTTALAAKELGRRFVGFDISEKYIDLATMRLAASSEKVAASAPLELPQDFESLVATNGQDRAAGPSGETIPRSKQRAQRANSRKQGPLPSAP